MEERISIGILLKLQHYTPTFCPSYIPPSNAQGNYKLILDSKGSG